MAAFDPSKLAYVGMNGGVKVFAYSGPVTVSDIITNGYLRTPPEGASIGDKVVFTAGEGTIIGLSPVSLSF